MIHFLIDGRELVLDADEFNQSGDFIFARKNDRVVAGVQRERCAAFWLENASDQVWPPIDACSTCGTTKGSITVWS